MNAPPVEAAPPPSAGWPRRKYVFALAFVFAFHVALVFLLGTRKQIVPRVPTGVPHLRLANPADELVALENPTLFALPNPHDVVSAAWRRLPPRPAKAYAWTGEPAYLQPAADDLGAAFRAFVQDRGPGASPLNFKPEPELVLPPAPAEPARPQATTDQITGELAARPVVSAVDLPLLARNDVIAPTTVQALVDTSGAVISAVVLQASGDAGADQRAVELARQFRFAPAPRLMFGDVRFLWHTVPLTSTNAPSH